MMHQLLEKILTSFNGKIIEANLSQVKRKQRTITSLFPTFHDRVNKVQNMGGVRLKEVDDDNWHFKVHSGTKSDVWYDCTLHFKNIQEMLKRLAKDRRLWTKDKTRVDLRKLASRFSEEVSVQVFCSCPAFLYWGPAHILSKPKYDAKYTKPETRPPVKRNPKQYGAVCFDERAMVLMGDGIFKSIKDVQIGDLVFTHTGKTKRVISTFSRNAEVIDASILGMFGDFGVTPDHEFYVRDKSGSLEWKPISSLNNSSPLYCPTIAGKRNIDDKFLTCGEYRFGGTFKSFGKIDVNNSKIATVYNIEVEDDNSYIVNGVAVHNCKHYHVVLKALPFYTTTIAKWLKDFYSKNIASYEKEAKKEFGWMKKAAAELGKRKELIKKERPGKVETRESVNEDTTTMDNISFLPSHLGSVRSILTNLKKEKPDWNIEILDGEGENDNQFTIEDRVRFSVPKKHWDGFMGLFKGKIAGKMLKLGDPLKESQTLFEDEWTKLRAKYTITGFVWYDGTFDTFDPRMEHEDAIELFKNKPDKFIDFVVDKKNPPPSMFLRVDHVMSRDEIKCINELIDGFEIAKLVVDIYMYDMTDVPSLYDRTFEPVEKSWAQKINKMFDVGKPIEEAVEKDMMDLRRELKQELERLFHDAEFGAVNESLNKWKLAFGAGKYRTNRTAISVEEQRRDRQRIYGKLLREYGKDKGNLEMLIDAIQDRRPLGQFEVFDQFDNLFGTRIENRVGDVILIFESAVDFIYDVAQTIYISDPEVLDEVEEQFESVKRSKNLLFPVGGKFQAGFFNSLKSMVEDSLSVESIEEPKYEKGE